MTPSLFHHVIRVWCRCGHRTLAIRMKWGACRRCREIARLEAERMEAEEARDAEGRSWKGFSDEEKALYG